MVVFCLLVVLVILAGTFYAGARYGRAVEAEAIAEAIRVEGYMDARYTAVKNTILDAAAREFDRVKRYL